METLIIKENDTKGMKRAGEIIREGGIVAFPTETVYGLGASAFNEDAVAKIYAAKGRPSDNPLIVHIADTADISLVAREVPEEAKKLLDTFAPGPFTVILKKNPNIPNAVTAGLDTVGVRIPSHPTARAFLSAAKVPVAAPSANLSGKPSPTRAKHVIRDMNGRADAIICGGESEVGVESTIIDMTAEVPTILRPGGLTREQLLTVLGDVIIDRHITEAVAENEQPKCPGMKYRHYAPDCEVVVIEGENAEKKMAELISKEKASGRRVAALTYRKSQLGADVEIFANGGNCELAAVLFDALRGFDEAGADIAFVQFSGDEEMGLAVKNRLYKAAGNNVIYV